MKKIENKKQHTDLWDNPMWSNICVSGLLKKEEREARQKKNLKKWIKFSIRNEKLCGKRMYKVVRYVYMKYRYHSKVVIKINMVNSKILK